MKEGLGNSNHDEHIRSLQEFISNPRSIGPKQKLQMTILKHIENHKVQVSDMFSKASDPVDNYKKIQYKVKELKLKQKDNLVNARGDQLEQAVKKKKEDALKQQKLAADLNKFYEKREIYQLTPRKYRQITLNPTNEEVYDRHRESTSPVRCPKTLLNQEQHEKREEILKALDHISMENT